MKKAIVISLIALAVVGFLGFLYYRGSVFSKEILKLEILGPETADAGEEIEYTVRYKNSGNFALEDPKLMLEFPEHSLTEDSGRRVVENLRDIYPGEENIAKFKARLLGKENDLKTVKAAIAYTPHNLSARYESSTTFTTKIGVVPINLNIDLPSKAEKGKEIAYSIRYFSNIDYPLENLSIKVEPLSGFAIEEAAPASLDNAEWKLKTLEKGEGASIKIKGAVTADVGSKLNFSARLGMWIDGNFVAIKETSQELEVIQPLLSLAQHINGSADYIADPGALLNYEIFLRNVGSHAFEDLFLLVRLDGQAFNLATLKSNSGQVRPNDNLIIFDARQAGELKNIMPGKEAKVSFQVQLKDSWIPPAAERNSQYLKSKVDVAGISQEFINKVNSKLELSQQAVPASQPDGGKAYAIQWQIKNHLNDVKHVKVKAVLPPGVLLITAISPESQVPNFSFDSSSREAIWSIGDMTAGTGVSSTALSISFQVSLPQSPALAVIIGQATASGEDQSTGAAIQTAVQAITLQ